MMLCETFTTYQTVVRLFTSVFEHVLANITLIQGDICTEFAWIGFDTGQMTLHVSRHKLVRIIGIRTVRALVQSVIDLLTLTAPIEGRLTVLRRKVAVTIIVNRYFFLVISVHSCNLPNRRKNNCQLLMYISLQIMVDM